MARAPIGMRIRERRRSLGRTQADLAKAAGISASYLNLIEHNKRQVGGALLRRLGEVLSVGIDYLDGAVERRLIQDLEEIATDPANADGEADPESATDLVARHRPWAGLIVNMHRTNLDQTATLHALSDRLRQDPFLSDAVHGMLSNIAAIRSTSEILASVDDVPEDQRARFHQNLAEESAKLSDVAQAMAGYFDRAP
ncbi:MAG: helix-turn-helix domain-containing protein, partial [Nisaea sp.]